uniref:ATPase SWSAP1 n=1 Tax=Centroberyx gerrardi TaxID=166262 RepID=UPI003AAD8F68
MTDILTLVFRTFIPQTGLTKDFKLICPSKTNCSTLVVGDHSISRSLLLLAAVTAASELGMKVLFFTQTQIQSLPVSLQNCFPNLSPDSLKKIKFSYPRTVEELLQQVACLHESASTPPTPPSLIIVDRLEGYLRGPGGGSHTGFHQGEQSCAAHVSALLCDTAAFLTQVLEQRASSSAPCRVVASFQAEPEVGQAGGEPSAPDPVLAVLDRYFQVRCTLDRDRSYGATAAGLQEVWHIFLSGTGITEAACAEGGEDKHPGVAQEWQLATFPNGLMEFTLV